jgi:hypothetical protein
MNIDQSEFADVSLGTFRDFLCGLAVGCTLGFVMLLCVWDRHVPHRQKVGILIGVVFNLILQKDVEGRGSSSTTSSVSPVSEPVPSPTDN